MTEHGVGSTEQRAGSRLLLRAPCSLLLLTAVLSSIGRPVDAQQPTASQVQQALQQQPGLSDMVRSRISQSGLTADQIRSRLQASGYPGTLLDPYLSATAPSGLVP